MGGDQIRILQTVADSNNNCSPNENHILDSIKKWIMVSLTLAYKNADWKCSLERDHSYSLLKPLIIHSMCTIHNDGGEDKAGC